MPRSKLTHQIVESGIEIRQFARAQRRKHRRHDERWLANSHPVGIAAGPDGNLWFTEGQTNKVAKVTTSGVFTEYTVPTSNSLLTGITAGPDGNLWFTEENGNKVAKVTTSGVFTEYILPSSSSGPIGIVAGPDGNLWFTEYQTNKVAKVTP